MDLVVLLYLAFCYSRWQVTNETREFSSGSVVKVVASNCCLQAWQVIWKMVELICFVACCLRIWAFKSSACACCLILWEFANSCSANSICRLACCRVSSAMAFSTMASLSCSRAPSFSLDATNAGSSIATSLLQLGWWFDSILSPWSHDPIESCSWVAWFLSEFGETEASKLLENGFIDGKSWSSRLLLWSVVVKGLFCSGRKKMGSVGFGILKPAQGTLVKFVSLEGLGLEAVRDKRGGCSVCNSERIRPALQISWCSMKLSTLRENKVIQTQ